MFMYWCIANTCCPQWYFTSIDSHCKSHLAPSPEPQEENRWKTVEERRGSGIRLRRRERGAAKLGFGLGCHGNRDATSDVEGCGRRRARAHRWAWLGVLVATRPEFVEPVHGSSQRNAESAFRDGHRGEAEEEVRGSKLRTRRLGQRRWRQPLRLRR